ncbi:competence protein ComEA [Nitrosospira sp. Nl5]|uniref:ComEA family DNA-binding protein n=1 Tax=Nitrosospira sp. Nl5 TaxID=200120 RepID=UPI000884D98D|nr:ComEA family DNA-binding protein [Nitrosospira sp. Nl5]SCX88944.1 competence protein ComEA [Nitrosospira sp. Nl5]
MKKLFITLVTMLAFPGAVSAAVNINTATQAELQTINGINAAKAKAIIDYRTKAGAFRSTDELENVEGISPTTVDMNEIRREVSITGPTVIKKEGKPASK